MRLGHRTLNNAIFNAGCGLIPLALGLILWPYIVSKLGDASYGIYALVGTVIGYFALLDLGLGNAVVKYVAEYIGRDDAKGVNLIFNVALLVFVTLGMVGILMILAVSKVLASHWLKIPPDLVTAAYHSFLAASAGFFFTMILTLLTAVTNGLNRYDISSVINMLMGAISTIGTAILLYMGKGLIEVVMLNVITPLLTIIVYIIVIKKLLPQLTFRPVFDWAMIKQILSFGMYAMLSRITDVIVRQLDLLIIGALLGVASVTYYVIPFTILNRVTSLVGRIGMVIFPAISELQGQERRDRIVELYMSTTRLILALSTAFSVPLLIFGHRFLYVWMGAEFAERGGLVIQLITIGVYFDLWTNVPTFVVDGIGKPKISGFTALIHGLLFIALLIPLALWKGIVGVAAAYMISTCIVAPLFVWFVNNRILKLEFFDLVRQALLPPLLTGLIIAIPLLMIPQTIITNMWILLGALAVGFFAYFIVALPMRVFDAHERSVIFDYATHMINKYIRKRNA